MKQKPKELEWASYKSHCHYYLNSKFGKPKTCDNPDCNGKCKTYDWCKKTDSEYTCNRDDYLRMCRSCHRKYDMTDEKLEQAKKNLYWVTGKKVKYAVGERCPKTKLNAKQVVEIRKEYKLGNIFQKDLGARYGISQRAVCSVVNRLSWRHIK